MWTSVLYVALKLDIKNGRQASSFLVIDSVHGVNKGSSCLVGFEELMHHQDAVLGQLQVTWHYELGGLCTRPHRDLRLEDIPGYFRKTGLKVFSR